MGFSIHWLALGLCTLALASPKMQLKYFEDAEVNDVDGANEENKLDKELPLDNEEEFGDEAELLVEDEEDEGDETRLPTRDFMDTNPEMVDGEPVFEGDILLDPEQWREVRERKGLASTAYRWPEGADGYPHVPYVFDSDSKLDKTTILSGIKYWMANTCIKFAQTTNFKQSHIKFIYGSGCYSKLGRLSSNGQPLSIGAGCNTLGTVAHEIGHAIGFVHEQSRPDRDNYVVINLANVNNGKKHNFKKYSNSFVNNRGVEYDYSSLMHYSSRAFSANGKTTIAPKDPFMQVVIGQRSGLSHRDKHIANIMYGCIGKWLAKCRMSADPCKNGGYFGAKCSCVCPRGTSGSQCERIIGSYYSGLLGSCSATITKPTRLTSPNYPNNYPRGQCVKVIDAPSCHLPKVTFSDFSLYDRNPYCSGRASCCYFDALEIRNNNPNYGNVYCGKDIAEGRSFTGKKRRMILYFRARSNLFKGWSLTVSFVKNPSCRSVEQ